MRTLKELAVQADAIVKEMEVLDAKITDLRNTNATEADVQDALGQYDAKEAEFKALEGEVARVKTIEARKAEANALLSKVSPIGESKTIVETSEVQKQKDYMDIFTKFMKHEKLGDIAMKALAPKSSSFSEKSGVQCAVLPEIVKNVVLGPKVCKSMGSSGSTVSNTTMSAFVDREFLNELYMEAFPVPQVIDRVRVIPTKAGDIDIPVVLQSDGTGKFGGLTFRWLAQEGDAKPDTNANGSSVRIQTHELAGSMKVSERLLSRSMINIEQLLIELSKSNLRYLLDTAIISGSGSGQPLGVINDSIRHIPRTALGTVAWADLIALKYALPQEDRARGAFVMVDECGREFESTTDNVGRPLFTPSVANGLYDRLVGFPFATNSNSPSLGEEGDIIFGNWSSYVVAMEQEIVMARSDHYDFVNNMVTFKAFLVAGGRAVLPRHFVTLTTASS